MLLFILICFIIDILDVRWVDILIFVVDEFGRCFYFWILVFIFDVVLFVLLKFEYNNIYVYICKYK